MDNNRYWFFGSKLNTALLLILIILMIFAIKIMLRNEATYFPYMDKEKVEQGGSNSQDLISFSILPNSKVQGVVSYRGVIKGGYFFEGNILVGVVDMNKKVIFQSNAMAKDDWMTAGPVSFEGNLDFSKLPKGPAYIEIHNDNASGLPANDKLVLIPIVVE